MRISLTQLPKNSSFKNRPEFLNGVRVIVGESAQLAPSASSQNIGFPRAEEISDPRHLQHESWRGSIDQIPTDRVPLAVPIVILIVSVVTISLFGDTLPVPLSCTNIEKTGMVVGRLLKMIAILALLLGHGMNVMTMKIVVSSIGLGTIEKEKENHRQLVTMIGPGSAIGSVIETGTENLTENARGRVTLRRTAKSPMSDANLGAGIPAQSILEYGKEWLPLRGWRLRVALPV